MGNAFKISLMKTNITITGFLSDKYNSLTEKTEIKHGQTHKSRNTVTTAHMKSLILSHTGFLLFPDDKDSFREHEVYVVIMFCLIWCERKISQE